jgi:hypothetical protein
MKEIIYEADNYQIHTYKLRKYKHSTIRIYLTRPYKKERAAVSLLLRNLLLYSTKKLKHEEFVKELNKAGYDSAYVFEKGSMRKVVLGNFSSESEAARALNNYRKAYRWFAEAWVSEI